MLLQLNDDSRPISSMIKVLQVEAMHSSVMHGASLAVFVKRMNLIHMGQSSLMITTTDTHERYGEPGIEAQLCFTGQPDLNVDYVFIPLAVLGNQSERRQPG